MSDDDASTARGPTPAGAPVGRRVVLGLLGLGALGVAAGQPLSRFTGRVVAGLAAHDPTGLTGLIPGGGWRYYTVTGGYPYEAAATYRLAVTGTVGRPLTLTTADLAQRRRTRLTSDFQCVTGWRVPGVRWEGVLLRDLLAEAGVGAGARAVLFTSYDGTYTESLTLDQAGREDVLVADTLDGTPIGRAHGGPVRLLVAPMYGYKSCKWLSEIRVTDRLVTGYWEQFGYDQDAWVGRSNGRHDAPTT